MTKAEADTVVHEIVTGAIVLGHMKAAREGSRRQRKLHLEQIRRVLGINENEAVRLVAHEPELSRQWLEDMSTRDIVGAVLCQHP